MIDLTIRLAHELGCSMEMSLTPAEIASPVWSDAIDGLRDARHFLVEKGVAIPEVIDNVLRTSCGEGAAAPT